MNRWEHWLTEEAAPMRAALSSRTCRARCAVCRLMRACRYEIRRDAFICSEDCWEERQKRESTPKVAEPFKMTVADG